MVNLRTGKLIIIEGTDGSGKQTQSELLAKRLSEKIGNNNVKNVKYSEDKIKGESNKTISEKDAIDMISNLTPNRL